MLEVFLYIFIFLLASYGAVSLTFCIMNSIRGRFTESKPRVKFVLLVKNNEEIIEGIVRSFFTEGIQEKLMANGSLTVVDMDSQDQTPELLERLKKDYECLMVYRKDEKDRVFTEEDYN